MSDASKYGLFTLAGLHYRLANEKSAWYNKLKRKGMSDAFCPDLQILVALLYLHDLEHMWLMILLQVRGLTQLLLEHRRHHP